MQRWYGTSCSQGQEDQIGDNHVICTCHRYTTIISQAALSHSSTMILRGLESITTPIYHSPYFGQTL